MTYKAEQTELVLACKRQDRKAQYRLYNQYSKAMYNICLRMLKDHMEAENVLQNTFLDVFRKIEQFRNESSLGSWIKRIAINNCLNQLKKKKIYWETIEDKTQVLLPEKDQIEIPYSVEKVKRAIHKLPDGYRIVFNLYCLEGYDHEEISQIVGISKSTSKSQLSRAKSKVRSIIRQNEANKNDYSDERGSNRQIH